MSDSYPQTVIEVIDPDQRFSDATLRAVRAFASSKPWSGSLKKRKEKFRQLNHELAEACGIPAPELRFGQIDGGNSGGSQYQRIAHRIVLTGKLSVVTYLHEFGHALGKDETDACRWSINLFRRCFPRQFSRLVHRGHMLLRADDVGRQLSIAGSGLAGDGMKAPPVCSADYFHSPPKTEDFEKSQRHRTRPNPPPSVAGVGAHEQFPSVDERCADGSRFASDPAQE